MKISFLLTLVVASMVAWASCAQADPFVAYNTVTYYHNDVTGSPVVATNQQAQVVWRKTYTPYGESTGKDSDNRKGFTGHVEDANGLVYAGARYYDPALGRFLSTDPVGFNEKNLMSFNRYAYANNNPYKYVDPDGRIAFLALLIPALEVAGAGITGFSIGTAASNVARGEQTVGDAALGAAPDVAMGLAGIGVAKIAGKLIGTAVKAADRPGGIPSDWLSKGSKKGDGSQYINPNNPHDRVRVMPGNPHSPNPAQQVPYVKRQIDGKFFDASGRQVPGDSPSAHIPLDQFKF